MNDISVKIVEPPKSPKEVAGSPSTLTGSENELDPLAIEDVGATKVSDVVKVLDEKAGSCDDNAKEKITAQNGEAEVKEEFPLETEISKDITEYVKIPSPEKIVPVELEDKDVPKLEEPMETETPELPVSPIKPNSKPESPKLVVDPVEKVEVIIKVPSPTKEVEEVKQVVVKQEVVVPEPARSPEVDQEMTEVAKVVEKIEPKVEEKSKNPMNGDIPKDEQGTKRRSSEEVETDSPLKKLCLEVERTFPQHDGMVNEYIQTATKNNIDEVQKHTEQLLSEIQTLRELAQKKEHEWNSILHLKKVKEEILLRLLRRKQVLSYEKSPEVNGQDSFDYFNQAKNLAIDKSDEISGLAIKQPGTTVNPMMQPPVMPMSPYNPMAGLPPPYDKAHLQNMPKPVFPQQLMLPGPLQGFPRDMNGQLPNYALPMGRQGPTKDVKSIIADYRQRNPDITPRRGRRMKSILNPGMMNSPRAIAPKMDSLNNLNNLANMNMGNMNNMAAMNSMGNLNNMASMNNINMIFNNLDMNQKAMLERLQQVQGGSMPNGMSFKDVLVQYANMQQNNPALVPNRVENIPIRPEQMRPEHARQEQARPDARRRPERPERTHDEQPHKSSERLSSPSPRLPPPPYPEISLLPVPAGREPSPTQQQNSLLHGILTKNCGEITITPVQPTPPPEAQLEKPEEVVQLDDDESPGSEGEAGASPGGAGRLVIDEGGADAGEDTPLCQGCKKKDAQFVCAGCANQWYCSRDCQVAAWDDHSDMCSG